MKNKHYTIRTMTRSEIDIAVEWAAKEGWNPGLQDADSFYAADPNGFLIGLLNGEPIACISAVRYGDSFGFIGFYIVHPDYRGKGYGLQIWDAALDYLKGRNVGLDGVLEQQENYKKSGFELAYRNIRFEGKSSGKFPQHEGLVKLNSLPFEEIEAYDRTFFPDNRSAFLQSWIRESNDKEGFAVVKEGQLQGYGMIRKCGLGYKIGPLFADNANLAEVLLLALTANLSPEEVFYFDTPEVNQAAVDLAEKYGMKRVFETARMYNQSNPAIDLQRLFGVTTFELG
ncbi:MAG: GNAT family N-acetyltransferase [Chitinophagales bacterium]